MVIGMDLATAGASSTKRGQTRRTTTPAATSATTAGPIAARAATRSGPRPFWSRGRSRFTGLAAALTTRLWILGRPARLQISRPQRRQVRQRLVGIGNRPERIAQRSRPQGPERAQAREQQKQKCADVSHGSLVARLAEGWRWSRQMKRYPRLKSVARARWWPEPAKPGYALRQATRNRPHEIPDYTRSRRGRRLDRRVPLDPWLRQPGRHARGSLSQRKGRHRRLLGRSFGTRIAADDRSAASGSGCLKWAPCCRPSAAHKPFEPSSGSAGRCPASGLRFRCPIIAQSPKVRCAVSSAPPALPWPSLWRSRRGHITYRPSIRSTLFCGLNR